MTHACPSCNAVNVVAGWYNPTNEVLPAPTLTVKCWKCGERWEPKPHYRQSRPQHANGVPEG